MGAMFAPTPPAAVTRVLSRFDRDQLAAFITVAIDLLDIADGDPDEDCCAAGDDNLGSIMPYPMTMGAADELRDGEDAEPAAWTEWHTRGRHKLSRGGEVRGQGSDPHEDAEDDDGDTGIEDDPLGCDPEEDQCSAGDDGCGFVRLGDKRGWGSDLENGRGLPKPVYGVDQTTGPIIDREAERERVARELGLVRSSTGGWRYLS